MGAILPAALGIAVNAFAIVAVIVVLFTKEGSANGITFLVGWIGGLLFVVAVVHALVMTGTSAVADDPSKALIQGLETLLVGLLFLGMGFRQWRKRQKSGADEPLPKWVSAADEKVTEGGVLTPTRSASLAFALAALNPKAIALVLTLSAVIARSNLTFIETTFDFLVFIAVASMTIAVPVVYRVVGGETAERRLRSWKRWLIDNRGLVSAGVLFLLGAMFTIKGIADLAGMNG